MERVYWTIFLFFMQVVYFSLCICYGLDYRSSILYFSISLPPSSPILVFWHAPRVRFYEYQRQSVLRGWFCKWWGIVWDQSRWCIHALFSSYGDYPIREAKLRAILHGIRITRRLGLTNSWIEVESSLEIYCLTCGWWCGIFNTILGHIKHLLFFDYDTLSYIYHKGNHLSFVTPPWKENELIKKHDIDYMFVRTWLKGKFMTIMDLFCIDL